MASADSWKQVIFETYRNHNIAIKQISTPNHCYGNHEWAWFSFGECVADDYQWAGLISGMLLSVVFTIFRFVTMSEIKKLFENQWLRVLLLTLFMDVLSLAGAVLAMQLLQVIFFDLLVTLTDLLILSLVLMSSLQNAVHRRAGYVEIEAQTNKTKVGGPRSFFRMSCLAICILATPIVVTSEMFPQLSRRSLEVIKFKESVSPSHYTHALVNTCGYVFGSIACFGQWALNMYALSYTWNKNQNGNDVTPQGSRSSRIGGVVLIACDFLYVVAILLNSTGWLVAVVTLPWVMQRMVHASFQTPSVFPSLWRCHDDPQTCPNDVINTLMVSRSDSESDSELDDSDSSNVLWDRTWKLPGIKDTFVYYPKGVKPNVNLFDEVRRKLVSGDVTTSNDSDWSSTSAEQELEWEDEGVSFGLPQSKAFHQPRETGFHNKRTPPQHLTPLILTPMATESPLERVRSWVSSSSPEEEKAPCLTAALDLDHNSNIFVGPNPFGDEEDLKKPSYLAKRKYSL